MKTDWTPFDVPFCDTEFAVLPSLNAEAAHAGALGARRNGLPTLLPYRWRPGDLRRDGEILERVAEAKRLAELRASQ